MGCSIVSRAMGAGWLCWAQARWGMLVGLVLLLALQPCGCKRARLPSPEPAVAHDVQHDLRKAILLRKQVHGEEPSLDFDAREGFYVARAVQRGKLSAEDAQSRSADMHAAVAVSECLARVKRQKAELAVDQFLAKYGTAAAPAVGELFVKEAAVAEVEPVYVADIARAYGNEIAPYLMKAYEEAGSTPQVYERILRHVAWAWSDDRQLQEYFGALDDRRRPDAGNGLVAIEGPGLWTSEVRYTAVELAGDVLGKLWGRKRTVAEMEADIAAFRQWYSENMLTDRTREP